VNYFARLRELDDAGSLLVPVERRVMILTGQSSLRAARLSPAQEAFLDAVTPPGWTALRAGFPYHAAMTGAAFEETSMIGASWRNAAQVAMSMASGEYREVVRRVLQRAMDTTEERLRIVTGSCGLQLLNCVWEELRGEAEVMALGPACFGTLRVPAEVVMGDRDGWSRLFYRGRVDRRVRGGHLDYWEVVR
jgi:hypothetical protein